MATPHPTLAGHALPDWVDEVATFGIDLTLRFRGIDRREGVLVRGPAGWAEFSPFVDYDADEARAWWRATTEAATLGFPAQVRDRVPVNSTVPVTTPERAQAIVRSQGCRTAKVKVADPRSSLDDDLARLSAVREALGSSGRVRIDANGAWSVDEALAAITRFWGVGLEYVEQPCASVEDLARLRALEPGVAIAADESIRRAEDPMRVKRAGAADVAIIKVQPLGGVSRCLRLADELGLPVVVSSAVETSVGLAAGVALAAALPDLPYACGLETQRLLAADVTATPLAPVDGTLPVGPVAVDPALLEACRAGEDVTAFWLARWERVNRIVEGRR